MAAKRGQTEVVSDCQFPLAILSVGTGINMESADNTRKHRFPKKLSIWDGVRSPWTGMPANRIPSFPKIINLPIQVDPGPSGILNTAQKTSIEKDILVLSKQSTRAQYCGFLFLRFSVCHSLVKDGRILSGGRIVTVL